MADPTDLFACAQELLEAAAESLDAIPLADAALLGAPARQFVATGIPVADCPEWLSVHVPIVPRMGVGPRGAGAVGGKQGFTSQIRQPELVITVARECVPTGTTSGTTYVPPDVAAIEAYSEQHLADVWALVNGILARLSAGVLFNECENVEVGTAIVAQPRGDSAGWTLPVAVQLDRYTEAGLGT